MSLLDGYGQRYRPGMHFNNYWKTRPAPRLYPHGKGLGLPAAPRSVHAQPNHAFKEKVRVRAIRAKRRARRLRRKLRAGE